MYRTFMNKILDVYIFAEKNFKFDRISNSVNRTKFIILLTKEVNQFQYTWTEIGSGTTKNAMER